MNTIAIALLINAAAIVITGVIVIKKIKRVNANIDNNINISCDVNSKLKDLDLEKIADELKKHLSKEMWDLSFRKVPNVVVIKKGEK